jgi:hypothetical protein
MKKVIFNIAITLFLVSLLPFTVHSQDNQLVIIGNTESVPSEMNMNQLKSVLKGEQMRWEDGSKVSIALMKTNTPVGTNTCKKLYNMSGNELNKYFLALVFQGKAKAPVFFNSETALESYVADTPGAIGVLEQINDDHLKRVLVDGKKQI